MLTSLLIEQINQRRKESSRGIPPYPDLEQMLDTIVALFTAPLTYEVVQRNEEKLKAILAPITDLSECREILVNIQSCLRALKSALPRENNVYEVLVRMYETVTDELENTQRFVPIRPELVKRTSNKESGVVQEEIYTLDLVSRTLREIVASVPVFSVDLDELKKNMQRLDTLLQKYSIGTQDNIDTLINLKEESMNALKRSTDPPVTAGLQSLIKLIQKHIPEENN